MVPELTVRPVRPEDWESIQKHTNSQEIAKWMRDSFIVPFSDLDSKTWANVASKNPDVYYAICFNDELIGLISLIRGGDVYSKSAELGYWIGVEHWNKGYTTDCINIVLDYYLHEFDVVRVYAEVFEGNESSMRVLRKLGFNSEVVFEKAIYKNGELFDSHIFSKVKY